MKTLSMKKVFLFLILYACMGLQLKAQVAINNDNSTPHPSAGLDVMFDNKGFLPPRMTRIQMAAIANPANGLMVYCSDCSNNATGALAMFLSGAWFTFIPTCLVPFIPTDGIHTAAIDQIVWNWNSVPDATGYRWSATNNYALATDMGTLTSQSETGLNCFTSYNRFVWSYNPCGNSLPLTLTQATLPCAGLPTITTSAVSNIAYTTSTSGGIVVSDGGNVVTSRGVCWSISPDPTIADSHVATGTGTGGFTSNMTDLLAGTDYFVRAYATNSTGTAYGNEVIFTTLPFDIGVAHAGGVIFYIDPTGQHGLVTSTTDQSTGAQWGCSGTLIGTSTALGTGQANTTAIVNACSQPGIAARLCNDLVLNGYGDWFLPSKDELFMMHQQLEGVIPFAFNIYRSSSENGAFFAWYLFWGDGQQNYSDRTWTYYVRAIRAF
jgi:hypothetical protein